MESKFKLGDVFTKKYTRDTIPIEINVICNKKGLDIYLNTINNESRDNC